MADELRQRVMEQPAAALRQGAVLDGLLRGRHYRRHVRLRSQALRQPARAVRQHGQMPRCGPPPACLLRAASLCFPSGPEPSPPGSSHAVACARAQSRRSHSLAPTTQAHAREPRAERRGLAPLGRGLPTLTRARARARALSPTLTLTLALTLTRTLTLTTLTLTLTSTLILALALALALAPAPTLTRRRAHLPRPRGQRSERGGGRVALRRAGRRAAPRLPPPLRQHARRPARRGAARRLTTTPTRALAQPEP